MRTICEQKCYRLSRFCVVILYLLVKLTVTSNGNKTANIYVKNCSVYIQCKGDIVVVDIKQHKSQFKNANITITQCQKNFADCVILFNSTLTVRRCDGE